MKNGNIHAQRYKWRMIANFTIYTAILFGVNIIDSTYALPQWQRIGLALLPIIPAIAMVFIILSFFRTMDEVFQKIITEAIIISAGIVGLGTFTLGFLGNVIPLPGNILIWIWPAMIAIQGVAMIFVRLRYS